MKAKSPIQSPSLLLFIALIAITITGCPKGKQKPAESEEGTVEQAIEEARRPQNAKHNAREEKASQVKNPDDFEEVMEEVKEAMGLAGDNLKLSAESTSDKLMNIEDYRIHDRMISSLLEGAIAYDPPDTMNVQESRDLELMISLKKTVDQLMEELNPRDSAIGARIRVAPIMQVSIISEDFKIISYSPQKQPISEHLDGVWQWSITPFKEGTGRLNVSVTALARIEGESVPYSIKVYQNVVTINITASQKLARFHTNYWQFIYGSIMIPLLALIYNAWWKKQTGRSLLESTKQLWKEHGRTILSLFLKIVQTILILIGLLVVFILFGVI